MFARRRRKDEEEPLVPHGLVWQATEEADAAERKRAAAASDAKISQTAPAQNRPAAPSVSNNAPKKSVASSPPLFWRSQRKPELVIPVKTLPTAAPIPPPKVEHFGRSDDRRPLVREPAIGLRGGFTTVREHVAGLVSAKRQLFFSLSPALRVQIKLLSARGSVALKLLRSEMRDDYQLWTKWNVRRRDFVSQTYSDLKLRAREEVGRISAKHKRWAGPRVSLSDASLPPRIPWRPMIRVRLRGLPLRARIGFTRLISEWKLERHALLSVRGRLAVLSLVALLSAMFVWALVSTARNYGTSSLPSHRLRSETPPVSKVLPIASEIPVKPPAIHADIPVKLEKRRAPQVKHNQTPQVRPKRRYNEEEDYVARDTYVYYGNKRAGSR